MIPIVATAKTWLRAFPGPCAILAGVALLAGGWGGFALAWKLQAGNVAKAELALSEFTGTLSAQAAEAERKAGERQLEAAAALADRDAAITAAVAAIPAKVARQLQPELAAFRSALNADPDLACLRNSLPADAIRLLQRPGGSVIAAPRD